MKTALLDGITPAKIDQQIMANLLLNIASADEVRQEKLLIGIRNEAGQIYRLIGAAKANNYTNAVEELEDLGMVDELTDTDGTEEGCDAIFSGG
ncbi:hypothetical protein [Massilia sp. PWRC2]|uniref:hypothetical protein n=1 Tax=Massilia sp. PWRC2 TaxID=2804626 RepID=UPI003CEA8CD8